MHTQALEMILLEHHFGTFITILSLCTIMYGK